MPSPCHTLDDLDEEVHDRPKRVYEARCAHGFLRSVVRCPECDVHCKWAPNGNGRLSDESLIEAIKRFGRVSVLESELGISKHLVMTRARKNPAVQKALDNRPRRHPQFKDITGKRFGSWKVLELCDERTWNGTTVWRCRHDCGAIHEVNGPQLRKYTPRTCKSCRGGKRSKGQ